MEKNLESEFLQLVMGLESSGWIALGKIANPLTGKIEKSLDAAKSVINTLTMLKEKTKGNLTKSEESVLNSALQNLQLNYVEEASKKEEVSENKEQTNSKESIEKQENKT